LFYIILYINIVILKLFYLYSDLKCVEYGPVKSDKPDGRQGPLFTHFIAYDKLKDFSDTNYTSDDISHLIERKCNFSSHLNKLFLIF